VVGQVGFFSNKQVCTLAFECKNQNDQRAQCANPIHFGICFFKLTSQVKKYRVERKSNEIVNRLNKTKVERNPDLLAEREEKLAAERFEKKKQQKEIDRQDKQTLEEKKRQAEARSYERVFKPSKMTSNAKHSGDVDVNAAEEDFM